MKRPSCKWKGQTDADEALPEVRVARLAECHIEQKAGYCQHASHFSNKRTFSYETLERHLFQWSIQSWPHAIWKEETHKNAYDQETKKVIQRETYIFILWTSSKATRQKLVTTHKLYPISRKYNPLESSGSSTNKIFRLWFFHSTQEYLLAHNYYCCNERNDISNL